jgi:hypothetical protein
VSEQRRPNRAERRRAARADRKGQWAKEQEEFEISREWEIDPEWQAYQTHVRTNVVPMIRDSELTISLVPTDPADVDVKFAVELGLSIMLDKPIVLVVDPTTVIPDRLRRVADEIVVGRPDEPGARDRLTAAIERIGGEGDTL